MALAERAELIARLSLDDDFTKKMDTAFSKLGQNMDAVERRTGSTGKVTSDIGNQAAKSGRRAATAFNIVDTVLDNTLGHATRLSDAWLEDRQSIARLEGALKANIEGWQGNT